MKILLSYFYAPKEEEGGKRLNAHLIWAVDPGDTPSSDFHVYHILPGRTNWIGVAHTNEFFVTRLHLQSGQDKAVFCVQPISVYGSAQSLEESAQIALSLQQPSRAGRDVTGELLFAPVGAPQLNNCLKI